MPVEDEEFEDGDLSVPSHLLDLHVQLEDANMPPDAFREVYDAEANLESSVGRSTSDEEKFGSTD